MKRMLRWIVRLYPTAWRQRYGAEFDALLDQIPPSPRTIMNVLGGALSMQLREWSFWKFATAGAIAGALLGAVGSFAVQPRYVSGALLRIETREPSTPQVRSQLVVNLVNRAMTQEALLGIARRQHLDTNVVTAMMKRILIKPTSNARDVFTVQFSGGDATQAQHVTQEIVAILIDANVHGTTDWRPLLEMMHPATLPKSPDTPKLLVASLGLFAGLLLGAAAASVLFRFIHVH